MKPLLPVLMTVLLLGALHAGAADSAAPGKTPAEPAKPLIIDVRTPGEFAGDHINGATNVPLQELEKRIGEVAPDKSAPIAVHCQSGGRSARASKLLQSKGYTHVQDLGSLAHARAELKKK